MKETQKDVELNATLTWHVHISRGQVIALGQEWRNLHTAYLKAVKECDRHEVRYTRLSVKLIENSRSSHETA